MTSRPLPDITIPARPLLPTSPPPPALPSTSDTESVYEDSDLHFYDDINEGQKCSSDREIVKNGYETVGFLSRSEEKLNYIFVMISL